MSRRTRKNPLESRFRVGGDEDTGPSRIVWALIGGVSLALGFKVVEHFLPPKTQTVYITSLPPSNNGDE